MKRWHGSSPAQGWEACITHPQTVTRTPPDTSSNALESLKYQHLALHQRLAACPSLLQPSLVNRNYGSALACHPSFQPCIQFGPRHPARKTRGSAGWLVSSARTACCAGRRESRRARGPVSKVAPACASPPRQEEKSYRVKSPSCCAAHPCPGLSLLPTALLKGDSADCTLSHSQCLDVLLKIPPPDFLHSASSGSDFISSVSEELLPYQQRQHQQTTELGLGEQPPVPSSCTTPCPHPMRFAGGDFFLWQGSRRGSQPWLAAASLPTLGTQREAARTCRAALGVLSSRDLVCFFFFEVCTFPFYSV